MPWKKTDTGVVHFISTKSGLWSKIVSEDTELDENSLLALARLGAVYLNKNRIFEDGEIKPEDYLRLHTDPRRYPIVPMGPQIVFENEGLVVIDKPAGLPCHATVDNACENILAYLQTELKKEILLTHRLDVPTSGLLVFAKNPEAQAHFHNLLKNREVEKIYEAEVEKPGPELGLYEHHMVKSRYAPKVVQDEANSETQVCQLRVLSKRDTEHSTILRIELLTGRTHQIRAQLGHMKFPIIGDEQYRNYSDKKPDQEIISLRCVNLKFPWHDQVVDLSL